MNDDQLPVGPTPPLPPPPDAFEAVRRRAAARRLQRGGIAAGVSLALFAGAFGVGALLGGGTSERDALVVGSPEPEPVVTATPEQPPPPTVESSPTATKAATSSPTPSAAASGTPRATASAAPAPSATAMPTPTVAPPTEPAQPQTWTLRVVDGSGTPVNRAWVHTVPESGQLRAQRVATDGTVALACGTADRYLVALWDLSLRSSFRQPRGMRNLAATWVQGSGPTYERARPVECRADGPTVVTTALAEGGTLTGRLTWIDPDGNEQPYADGANPGGGLYCLALGVPGSQAQCADWDPVDGRYRFTGLPTGDYALQGMYAQRTVEVRAGRTIELDWYECDGCRQGEKPKPTPTATPSP